MKEKQDWKKTLWQLRREWVRAKEAENKKPRQVPATGEKVKPKFHPQTKRNAKSTENL